MKYALFTKIIGLSQSKDWNKIINEWLLSDFYIAQNNRPQTCLCGKNPIWHINILKHKISGKEVIIGSCCIHKFSKELDYCKDIKRIKKDPIKSVGLLFLGHLLEHKIINEWEYNWYCNIAKLRKLTPRMIIVKIRINKKILGHTIR